MAVVVHWLSHCSKLREYLYLVGTEIQSPRSDASVVTESGTTTNGRPTSASDVSIPEDVVESPSRSKLQRPGSGESESSIPEEVGPDSRYSATIYVVSIVLFHLSFVCGA